MFIAHYALLLPGVKSLETGRLAPLIPLFRGIVLSVDLEDDDKTACACCP
jgi:hypothetical protein